MFSKALRLFALVTLVFTFGCSSDDDSSTGGSIDEVDLIGTWNIVTLVSELPLDVDEDGTASENLHTESDCVVEQLIFNADGTWSGDSEYALEFLTELQGVLCFDNSRNGTWTLDGNALSLVASGVDRTVSISLSADTLSFNLLGGLGFDTTVVIGSYAKQ
ncbi:DUF5004 domain-containing protein [Psychroserpens algicola]|uniref:DUF5004 domain-containing protein n=1 Tax=Psychroserpens algicola TaxID=1719034 RepID=A0ABT0HA48_9FLAO|nr:DUF5004 domain-containing protein [Psychroserpens algicola]MCK8480715.1 DUF5004 domain-containing protein [Psychroserpens algicola]